MKNSKLSQECLRRDAFARTVLLEKRQFRNWSEARRNKPKLKYREQKALDSETWSLLHREVRKATTSLCSKIGFLLQKTWLFVVKHFFIMMSHCSLLFRHLRYHCPLPHSLTASLSHCLTAPLLLQCLPMSPPHCHTSNVSLWPSIATVPLLHCLTFPSPHRSTAQLH